MMDAQTIGLLERAGPAPQPATGQCPFAALQERIRTREARVAVIGLGYVGLPLALTCAQGGFRSTGLDIDARKLAVLHRGESPITDVQPAEVQEAFANGRFRASDDFDFLGEADAIIICVPTPLRKTKEPDISAIVAATREIAQRLRPGQLVILESTTYPGTTDEVLIPLLS